MATQRKKESAARAVKTPSDENGGNFMGSVFIVAFLTTFCYGCAFLCNDISGCPVPSVLTPSSFSWASFKQEIGWPREGVSGLVDLNVLKNMLGYHVLMLTLHKLSPGGETEGTKLSSGGRLKYKITVRWSALAVLVSCAIGTIIYGHKFVLWTFINDNYLQILTANIIFSYALATFVYIHSFGVKPGNKDLRELASHSGDWLTNWAIGRELNPRVTLPLLGEIDIKEFCLYHPGLIGWLLMDYAFIAKQYTSYGYASDSLVLVVGLQTFYMLDAFWVEERILNVLDVTEFGFGFLLSFGNLVWVPFVSSLQARYLAAHPVDLGLWKSVGIVAIFFAGYWIFRASNNQKHYYRKNPNDPRVSHLRYLKTGKSNLLITGWWGSARHINYLGDWLMTWGYSLPTGLAGYVVNDSHGVKGGDARGWGMFITYFYVLYFAMLLIDRAEKDDLRCAAKYGEDWNKYKKVVKYKFVPGIY